MKLGKPRGGTLIRTFIWEMRNGQVKYLGFLFVARGRRTPWWGKKDVQDRKSSNQINEEEFDDKGCQGSIKKLMVD